jgi:hypothetical protein
VDPEVLIKAYKKQTTEFSGSLELLSVASINANIHVLYEFHIKASIITLYLGLIYDYRRSNSGDIIETSRASLNFLKSTPIRFLFKLSSDLVRCSRRFNHDSYRFGSYSSLIEYPSP